MLVEEAERVGYEAVKIEVWMPRLCGEMEDSNWLKSNFMVHESTHYVARV